MSDPGSPRVLPLGPLDRPAPGPAPTLLHELADLRPVRTRAPGRTLLTVAIAASIFPLHAFLQFPLREDLSALPMAWFIPVALLWLGGFLLPLARALRPRRGQVLPDNGAAGRAALAAALLLTAASLFTIDAPGHTIMPAASWAGFSDAFWHCVSFGLRILLPVLLAGTVALARVMVVGAPRLGAAIGAAGGALSGFVLHALCPVGGALHVVSAHAGAVLLGATLGALIFPAVRALVARASLAPLPRRS
jgi:hypothetical protein